jgi:hypothetical protein
MPPWVGMVVLEMESREWKGEILGSRSTGLTEVMRE